MFQEITDVEKKWQDVLVSFLKVRTLNPRVTSQLCFNRIPMRDWPCLHWVIISVVTV